jgi:hypothetical protein
MGLGHESKLDKSLLLYKGDEVSLENYCHGLF